ncbi:hypothetical protein CEF00_13125 [Lactobacillus crispatus]|nr:hypothetical protein CEF00_13125 [Lactobacillus crispatus]
MVGDGFSVPDEAGRFDRIIVTAAMESVPEDLIGLLEPEGILIAPVGPQMGGQVLVRLRQPPEGVERTELVGVRFVPALPGVAREM